MLRRNHLLKSVQMWWTFNVIFKIGFWIVALACYVASISETKLIQIYYLREQKVYFLRKTKEGLCNFQITLYQFIACFFFFYKTLLPDLQEKVKIVQQTQWHFCLLWDLNTWQVASMLEWQNCKEILVKSCTRLIELWSI